jgi:hypothetical protein
MSSALLSLIFLGVAASNPLAPASAAMLAQRSAELSVQAATSRSAQPVAPKPLGRTNAKPRAHIEDNDERLSRNSDSQATVGSTFRFDPQSALLHRGPSGTATAARRTISLVYVFCTLLI